MEEQKQQPQEFEFNITDFVSDIAVGNYNGEPGFYATLSREAPEIQTATKREQIRHYLKVGGAAAMAALTAAGCYLVWVGSKSVEFASNNWTKAFRIVVIPASSHFPEAL